MNTRLVMTTLGLAVIGFMMADATAQRRGGGARGGGARNAGNAQHSGHYGGGGQHGGRGGFVPVDQRGPAYWEAQRRGTPAHWDLVYGTQPTYGNQGYYGSQWDHRNTGQGAPGPGPRANTPGPGPGQPKNKAKKKAHRSALSSGSMVTDNGMGHVNAARKGNAKVPRRRPLRKWTPGVYRSKGRAVRREFRDFDAFTPAWYKRHHCWWHPRWTARAAWRWATWDNFVVWYGIDSDPYYYDYGGNVMYDDGQVYADGDSVGTYEEYYDQASTLATDGDESDDEDDWNAFGVYGVIHGDQRTADKVIQLAGNDEGAIRGTYYDLVADETHDITGAVDPDTQRVSFAIGKKKTTVCETGLDNLSREEAPLLVLRGADKPQNWLLVRLGPDEE